MVHPVLQRLIKTKSISKKVLTLLQRLIKTKNITKKMLPNMAENVFFNTVKQHICKYKQMLQQY